jgi:hypothetical protein
MLPVFIDRCGAVRQAELIPSVAVEKGTEAVISVNFGGSAERRFNALQSEF